MWTTREKRWGGRQGIAERRRADLNLLGRFRFNQVPKPVQDMIVEEGRHLEGNPLRVLDAGARKVLLHWAAKL